MPPNVSDVMTRDPVTCIVPSSIEQVVKILTKNNVTGAPIVDASGKYVGMISRRDIFKSPEETQTAMVMRTPDAVRESDDIAVAANSMISQGKRHVPVVNNEDKVVGILTPQNLLPTILGTHGSKKISELHIASAHMIWEKTPVNVLFSMVRLASNYVYVVLDSEGLMSGLVTDRDIFDKIEVRREAVHSEGGMDEDEDPWTWDGLRNMVQYAVLKNMITIPDLPVSEIMIKTPKVVYKGSALQDAINVMLQGNFNQIPVMHGDRRPMGILNDIDIMQVLA